MTVRAGLQSLSSHNGGGQSGSVTLTTTGNVARVSVDPVTAVTALPERMSRPLRRGRRPTPYQEPTQSPRTGTATPLAAPGTSTRWRYTLPAASRAATVFAAGIYQATWSLCVAKGDLGLMRRHSVRRHCSVRMLFCCGRPSRRCPPRLRRRHSRCRRCAARWRVSIPFPSPCGFFQPIPTGIASPLAVRVYDQAFAPVSATVTPSDFSLAPVMLRGRCWSWCRSPAGPA